MCPVKVSHEYVRTFFLSWHGDPHLNCVYLLAQIQDSGSWKRSEEIMGKIWIILWNCQLFSTDYRGTWGFNLGVLVEYHYYVERIQVLESTKTKMFVRVWPQGSKQIGCVCVCLYARCDLTFHKFHVALGRKKLGKLLKLHTKKISLIVLFCSLSVHFSVCSIHRCCRL